MNANELHGLSMKEQATFLFEGKCEDLPQWTWLLILEKKDSAGDKPMTEKRARALHRAMWHWLAKHPGSIKDDCPGWWIAEQDEEVYNVFEDKQCFACLIADDDCVKCPIREKAGKCGTFFSIWNEYQEKLLGSAPLDEWADVCNRMADAWREIPEGNHE